jgi:N-acyl-D-amino-acid deacylase
LKSAYPFYSHPGSDPIKALSPEALKEVFRDPGFRDGVRRLTSHQAGLYGIPDCGRIKLGAFADLLLFDPASVGVSLARRVNDLPGGGLRTIRDPIGVHGVFVNGVKVFDGARYCQLAEGPGQVLDRFLPTGPAAVRSAAE